MTVKVPEPEPVQLWALVTVTEYVPATFTLMVEVVAPVLHANEVAGPFAVTFAVKVAEEPWQTSALLTLTVGFVLKAPSAKSLS